ncbi:distal membrane-arm assembly complex protein 2-like [Uloborus diversus]|uniref:distal membrane-arm assembly complex protein 2-like n=1 Tax=Uloborus diversus TaxID=327109 RepID=UPI00240A505C|nr:distal membrane-arm assembly complex protein 2-like [Uloborus diversus]XP_054707286.1 distal membrane-arm assembly complex protein 2-like [Uloborus diversus]
MNQYILKSFALTSGYIPRRSKVRNLPKTYDDFETPFMKTRKPGRTWLTNFYAFVQQKNITLADLKNWKKWKEFDAMVEDQIYLPERHKILGPDLATAHFILARGGRLKFKGSNKWMTREHLLKEIVPSSYNASFRIEHIDFSGSNLCYEGFENLCNLKDLQTLVLRNCKYVDDWCLSRSHFYASSLKYLDLSGCHSVTDRGVCTLHVLKNLETLVLQNTPNIQNRELVCLLLQEIIPKCRIIGVDYEDPVLLERLKLSANSSL